MTEPTEQQKKEWGWVGTAPTSDAQIKAELDRDVGPPRD